MSLSQTPFDKFSADCQASGAETALGNLADYLVQQKRFHELFEIRKLQLRQQLGLPIDKWQAIDELPPDKGEELEKGLLEICREIGTRFLEYGEVAYGWQYLEPVGDRLAVASLLRAIEPTQENVEELIQVSVGHGIEPELGFQLVLDRFGTCSSITTYESQLAMQPLKVRRGPARMLVHHLYDELVGRVQQSIEESEGQPPTTDCLRKLMQGRDWLFEGLSHHIDTTHLASTIRIAKILDDQASIEKAIELADYGSRLHDDFQYSGQIPFEKIYADTGEFLRALVGQQPDQAVRRLASVADANADSGNLDAAVWYVYLLDRLQRGEDAIKAYLELVHSQQSEAMISEDVCPNLTYLVSKYGCFDLVRESLTCQGDLLGFATVASIQLQQHDD